MEARLGTVADQPLLERFCCVRTGEECETEVEEFINELVIGWLQSTPDARLLLYFDDEGDLIGFAAHEPAVPADPSRGRYLSFIGVSAAAQGNEIGPDILESVFDDASAICPGGTLTWLVHPSNHGSQKMCKKKGFDDDWTMPPKSSPYMEYNVDLD